MTCTFTNSAAPPQLKLVKHVTTDDGGTATAADFTLAADASTGSDLRDFTSKTATPIFHNVFGGVAYDLSESGPAGYTAGSWSCTGGTMNAAHTQVTVALGGSATCDITNDDQVAQLKLVKHVTTDDGGTATAADFTLAADASTGSDLRDFTSKTATPIFHNVFGGVAYDLSESGPAGYTAGSWSCTGGTMNAAHTQVTVALGGSATCDITNDDQVAQLKLVKHVTTDDGGTATAADFTLAADASTGSDLRDFTSKTATPIFHNVFGGVAYDLSESGPAGYTAGSWSCTGGTMNAAHTQVTVALGGSATCDITNDDQVAQLKLVKHVTTDDGGTATAADFTLAADASTGSDLRDFTSKTATPIFHNVFGGVAYDLSESGPAGYTAGSWSCTGGTMNAAHTQVTVALGGSATCDITNDDQVAQLKLVKHVTTDDGGTATAADFTLAADASTGSDLRDFTSKTATPIFHNVFGGVAYDLSESGPAGYTAGSWSCTGGTMNAAHTQVTVALGGSATCDITNDDNTPTLKLVKTVTNNDGGAKVANDWTLTATSEAGRNISTAGGSGVFENVFANAGYTLDESGPAGYSTQGWSCDGGTLEDGVVTLGLGDQVTCTIVNTDDTPQLKLVKTVTNNDGGAKVANDWTLTATSEAGRNISTAGGSGVFENVFANAGYTLDESGPTGYSTEGWSCDGGTLEDGVVTLGLGDQVTCTIVNTDDTPQLKLVKTVTNNDGGTATAADFTLTATAAAQADQSRNFSSKTATPVFHDVFGNVTYALSESGPGGYTAGSWSCDAGTQSGSQVTLALGQKATCTIVNDDVPKPPPPGSGALAIAKTLSGGPVDYSGPFTIAYSCSNGSNTIAGTVTVTAGGSQTVYNIPNGYVCNVTENLPAAPAGYAWSTPVINGSPTGAIAGNSTANVSVVNQLNPLPVQPAVVVPPPAFVPVPQAATIPSSVPAGGGYYGQQKSDPRGALVLLFLGLVGVLTASARKRMLRKE